MFIQYLASLCLLLGAYAYESKIEEDLMKCYDQSKLNPNTPEDCTKINFENQLYRCCYLQKTPRREGENKQLKQCVRIFYDENTIRDINYELSNDYREVSIICSSQYLILSYMFFAIILILIL